MSNAEKSTIDENFAAKLGIEMTSPRMFARLIELTAGTREVIAAVGPSGVGKTAIPKQIAAARNGGKGVPYVGLHVPTLNMEDLQIPTMASDTKTYFDRRIPRRFQALLDWVDKVKRDNDGEVPADMCPILSLEELNRAVDKAVTRALFTLLDDRYIGDVYLDESIQIVVTMNPTGGGMAVNEFEKDPAMRRRLRMIGVPYSYSDFYAHATEAKFHRDVLAHLGAQPTHGYDEQGALSGKAFACPATWESVSRMCFRFDQLNVSLSSPEARAAISGAVGVGSATAFLEYIKDRSRVLTPEDILTRYHSDPEVRCLLKQYAEEDRLDKTSALCSSVVEDIFAHRNTRTPEQIAEPFAWYFSDLNDEHKMQTVQQITEKAASLGSDASAFRLALNRAVSKQPKYVEAMEKLGNAKARIRAAAEKK